MKLSYKFNQTGNEYVGLIIKNPNEVQICFPIGYKLDVDKNNLSEIKKEIIKLLKLLTKKTYIDYNIEKNDKVNINIFSAINVMEDFFKYGLYQERQKECKLNCKGHINWKRTINIPQLYLNKGILYKNIYKEYINYAFTENIQEIQKYCLLQISKTIGFLFDFSYKPNINKRFKKLQMIEIINSELKKSIKTQK